MHYPSNAPMPLNVYLTMPHLCITPINPHRVAALDSIERLVVVGSSASGKSTLVNALREDEALARDLQFAKRYVTRPQRKNDGINENKFVGEDEFNGKKDQGIINVSWTRNLGNKVVRYGFEREDPNKLLTVYSANNAFFDQRETIFTNDQLAKTLFVGVYASQDTRTKRFQGRSPDIIKDKPTEATTRMADVGPFPTAYLERISKLPTPLAAIALSVMPKYLQDPNSYPDFAIYNEADLAQITTTAFTQFVKGIIQTQGKASYFPNHKLLRSTTIL